MKFKTTTLVTLLTASSLMMATNAFATTFKVAIGDSQGSAQWEMASKFKASFEATNAPFDFLNPTVGILFLQVVCLAYLIN